MAAFSAGFFAAGAAGLPVEMNFGAGATGSGIDHPHLMQAALGSNGGSSEVCTLVHRPYGPADSAFPHFR